MYFFIILIKLIAPQWASSNLGVFICIRCSGLHRKLGVHISFVRSVNLDSWTAKEVKIMQRWGNAKANSYWERKMPEGFPRPTENSTMEEAEAFIRVKYEQQSFVDPSFDPNLQPIATPTLTPVSTPRETDEEEEDEVGSNNDNKHHHSHSTSRHSSHRHHSHHRSSSSKKEDGLDGFFNDDNKPKDELNDGIEKVVEKLDDFHLNNESIILFILYIIIVLMHAKPKEVINPSNGVDPLNVYLAPQPSKQQVKKIEKAQKANMLMMGMMGNNANGMMGMGMGMGMMNMGNMSMNMNRGAGNRNVFGGGMM